MRRNTEPKKKVHDRRKIIMIKRTGAERKGKKRKGRKGRRRS